MDYWDKLKMEEEEREIDQRIDELIETTKAMKKKAYEVGKALDDDIEWLDNAIMNFNGQI